MIILKNSEEIEKMREGGRQLAKILEAAREFAIPGRDLASVNEYVGRLCLKYKVRPSFKNYGGYPANICISLNDEVVHGIPTKKRIIQEGDLVSLDFGVLRDDLNTDSALTYVAGRSDDKVKEKLIKAAEKSFRAGIAVIKSGVFLGDVSWAIEKEIEKNGFFTVKCLAGHGIGAELHESPIIPNFGKRGTGVILEEGMTLAIEPMITENDTELYVKDDGWTYATMDGCLASHYEHTIVVTKSGCEILTKI